MNFAIFLMLMVVIVTTQALVATMEGVGSKASILWRSNGIGVLVTDEPLKPKEIIPMETHKSVWKSIKDYLFVGKENGPPRLVFF